MNEELQAGTPPHASKLSTRNTIMDDLRYPIGRFKHADAITDEDLRQWIDDIAALPDQLRDAVAGLSEAQLDTTYRPGGWTLRQVVHHVGDSHMNALIRFKWALTEDRPTIKPYYEDRWAELSDYDAVPVETSLDFIARLHERWVTLLRSLTREDLTREFVHPESGTVRLDWNVGMYAWHGRHHLAHITQTREREGWTAEKA